MVFMGFFVDLWGKKTHRRSSPSLKRFTAVLRLCYVLYTVQYTVRYTVKSLYWEAGVCCERIIV